MSKKTHHVADYKKKIVKDICKYVKEYPIIGLVNMENLPAPQLQGMRKKLKDQLYIYMTKKRLMRIALEQSDKEKSGIKELEKQFKGMPALIFTKENPFKLAKNLKDNKSNAPAKPGQEAPFDIIIPKGPTSFAPGPIISELSGIGIKTGVEGGKVAVKEDSTVAKKGDKISPKAAEVMTRMGIEPMEVGLDLVAVFENGVIYTKDILEIDEKEFMNRFNTAAAGAFNLAVYIEYPSKDTMKTLIGKAFNDAKVIGLEQNIIDEGVINDLLGKAERSMLSLKDAGNIDVKAKPKEEAKETAKPEVKEEKQPEAKAEEKPIEKKPEPEKPKVEEKKEEQPVEKKEEPKVEENKPEPKPEVKKEAKVEEKKPEEKKIEVKEELKKPVKQIEEPKTDEPEIEPKEAEKEEDVYDEEEREQEVEDGEISPGEAGFVKGYEDAGKTEEEKKEEPADVDNKVKKMVEETKKFASGDSGPSADDLLNEVDDKEPVKEIPKEPPITKAEIRQEPKPVVKDIPKAHDLAKKKEPKKEDADMKAVEELTKKLVKKGTLRDKK